MITALVMENAIIKDAKQGSLHTHVQCLGLYETVSLSEASIAGDGPGFSSTHGIEEGKKGFQIFVIKTQMKSGLTIEKHEGKMVPELGPTSQG